jgi:hypothetical protein
MASDYSAWMVPRRTFPVGFVDPCIPTLAAKPPFGPDWVHEVKHDGYRLVVRRDGKAVRLFTRRGHDSIANPHCHGRRARSFTLDGEAVVSGAGGVSPSVRGWASAQASVLSGRHRGSPSSTAASAIEGWIVLG